QDHFFAANSRKLISGHALAHDRALPRRKDAGGRGRAKPAACVLRRGSKWGSLEIDRLWAHMETDRQQPAYEVDWGNCDPSFESRCCVRGEWRRTAAARPLSR